MEPYVLVCAGLSALCAVVAALYVRFSGPVVATHELRATQAVVESLRAEWIRTKTDLGGIQDAIADDLDRSVRARNRANAALAKEQKLLEREQGAADNGGPITLEQARALARQRGIIR